MPVKPENRARYPWDWPAIATAVKEAAGWRCECTGECGGKAHAYWHSISPQQPRCFAIHGGPSPYRGLSGYTVVMTVAHLNHIPEDCSVENLKAMCPYCHLNYDRDHHAATRKARRERLASGHDGG